MKEKDLIKGLRRRSEKCFDIIYDKYYNLVLYVILKYVNNKDDANDIAVDTFLAMYNKIDQHDDDKSFKYWLLTIAKNKARRFLEEKREGAVLDNEIVLNCSDDLGYSPLIEACKNLLTPLEFDIVNYHIIFELSFRDIAGLCNISYMEAYRSYKKSMSLLKRKLGDINVF